MDIYASLADGDLRSIGKANEVAEYVAQNPVHLQTLLEGLRHDDPRVRMRCADAAEKLSHGHATWFADWHGLLLAAGKQAQQEVRWHVAQILPRLQLNSQEHEQALALLFEFLSDKSRIVTVSAMTALVEMTKDKPEQQERVRRILIEASQTGSPAQRKRAEKLLGRI